MPESLLTAENLTKDYGSFRALAGLNLSSNRAKSSGLLGPNGSGKSTALRLMLGFLKPTAGRAAIAGFDCWPRASRPASASLIFPANCGSTTP